VLLSTLPGFAPMRPASAERPFDSPDWIFEVKYDGLRAFACCDGQNSVLLTPEGKVYTGFPTLTRCLAEALGGVPAVLDGEIVHLDETGRPRYRSLVARKRPQHFYAFDLLMLNHEDLRKLPLYERKNLLADIIAGSRFIRNAPHVPERGRALFEAACCHDLEGVVAKWRHGPYLPGRSWLALRNQRYSQARAARRRRRAHS
jgi:bifunctional non-homologous end joining protein LigD